MVLKKKTLIPLSIGATMPVPLQSLFILRATKLSGQPSNHESLQTKTINNDHSHSPLLQLFCLLHFKVS